MNLFYLISEEQDDPKCGLLDFSCEGKCGEYEGQCSCNSLCYAKGNCCFDYYIYCMDEWIENNRIKANVTSFDSYFTYKEVDLTKEMKNFDPSKYFLPNVVKYMQLKFFYELNLNLKHDKQYNHKCVHLGMGVHINVVARCYDGTLCSDSKFIVKQKNAYGPLYSFYLNQECALCNHIPLDLISHSKEIFDCNETNHIDDAASNILRLKGTRAFYQFISEKCESLILPPTNDMSAADSACDPTGNYIETCPPEYDNSTTDETCQFFLMPVYHQGKIYKNPICYFCHQNDQNRHSNVNSLEKHPQFSCPSGHNTPAQVVQTSIAL